MSFCCPCKRNGTCSTCACKKKGCKNCRNSSCKFGKIQEKCDMVPKHPFFDKLPETRIEAIDKAVKILMEMEFRSVRGAYMCYKLSDKNEVKHFRITVLVALSVAILSVPFNNYIVNFRDTSTSDGVLSLFYNFIMFLIVGCAMFFKVCPDNILPLYDSKCKKYNEAGAGWQELEFKIRAFLATEIKGDISPTAVRDAIYKFAEERRKVCEIARPTQEIRKYCEENPTKFKQRKSDLEKGFSSYWGFNGNTDTSTPGQGTWLSVLKDWFMFRRR